MALESLRLIAPFCTELKKITLPRARDVTQVITPHSLHILGLLPGTMQVGESWPQTSSGIVFCRTEMERILLLRTTTTNMGVWRTARETPVVGSVTL